jgi:hypothetical protein
MSRHRLIRFLLCLALAIPLASLYSCSSGTAIEAKPVPPPGPVAGDGKTTTKAEPPKAPVDEKPHFERPEVVKGIYVTAWAAGGKKSMDRLLGLVDRTELNAMVIDLRDNGEMYFKTGIKLQSDAKATNLAVVKPKAMMQKLAKHSVWPIARIACFRDRYVPIKFPDLAIQNPNGTAWKDRSGHTWLDPYNKKNWDYIADTVKFALDLGFPEIQLDYVRFASEGKSASQVFPGKATYPDQKAKPADVIEAFATYIGKKVRARGAAYSTDIFGIISSSKKDQGIGQDLEKVAEPFDVISPMVYPSHFANGEYGIANPNKSPYAIIKKSLADFKARLPKKPVRPWLQDFSLFGVQYGAAQVKAQIKAAKDLGYDEFLLWNAGTRYTEAALERAAKTPDFN